ncbi:hypothetical protein Syun_007876 [Stephania yunnanensis]|uniref:Bidirectional sugar transporter SWEET n=1 Tax=Stephania yunnanensis TaxID=152371 RepID=A0AAP0L1V0_9MAGN
MGSAHHSFSTMVVSTLQSVYPSLSLFVRIPQQASSVHHHSSSGDHLRLSIGVVGNVVSLMLFAAPILTFKRVIKEKSTGEFSCVPYVAALMNCLIYSWYGSPMVSNNWENLPLFTVDGLGILFECSFVIVYLSFASPRGKKAVYYMVTPVVGGFVAMVVSTSLLKDHHLRKALVGGFGLVASIVMYSSPLVVVKRVIKTKSVEFMPFSLSLFSFLSSCLWTTYGILAHDLLLMLPSIIGCPIGIFQIVLYFMYRKRRPSTLEIPLKIAMVQNVTPSRVDIFDENEPAALSIQMKIWRRMKKL